MSSREEPDGRQGAARRIVVFSRDAGLSVALRSLADRDDRIMQFAEPSEILAGLNPQHDVVVLDLEPGEREAAYERVRGNFPGRLVLLLAGEERGARLPDDPNRVVVKRPFQVVDLWNALNAPMPPVGSRGGRGADRRAQLWRSGQRAAAGPEQEPPASGQAAGAAAAQGAAGEAPGQPPALPPAPGGEPPPAVPAPQPPGAASHNDLPRRAATPPRAPTPPAAEQQPTAWPGPGELAGVWTPPATPPDTIPPDGFTRVDTMAYAARQASKDRPGAQDPPGGTPPRRGGLLPGLLTFVLLATGAVALSGFLAGGGPPPAGREAAAAQAAAGAARTGELAWEQAAGEPLALTLVKAAWLELAAGGGGTDPTGDARLLTRGLAGVAVGLTALLALALTPSVPTPRRTLVAVLAGALAALDPALVHSGQLATPAALGLPLALLAVFLAWALRNGPALGWALAVGTASGLAALADPRAAALAGVPLLYAWLDRGARMMGRSLLALGIGGLVWASLPLVAGRAGVPLAEAAGWSAWGAGPEVAWASTTTVLLAAALLAAAALWLDHGHAPSTYLLAWLAAGMAGGALQLAAGRLDRVGLAYLVPGAAVALTAGLDLVLAGVRGRRVARAGGVARQALGALVVAALAGASVALWPGVPAAGGAAPPAGDEAVRQVAEIIRTSTPACAAVNASGPEDRELLAASGRTVTMYADGSEALRHGVRYFLLKQDDVAEPGGPMSPELAAWLADNGRPVASLPSPVHQRVQLWRVSAGPFHQVADYQELPGGGAFVNASGSACGGYAVTDSEQGAFFSGYQAMGGKRLVGRPLSGVWQEQGRSLQAFDTMVLAAERGGPARPINLVPRLAQRAPGLFEEHNLPLPDGQPPASPRLLRRMLTDAAITRAYLGKDPFLATDEDWRRARERLGAPLGEAQVMPDGVLRQPFERVVIERVGAGTARFASLGRLALDAGLVPQEARQLQPVPGLAQAGAVLVAGGVPIRGYQLLLGALLAVLLAATAASLPARRAQAAPEPDLPPGTPAA